MATRTQRVTKLKELELKFRGIAIEDGLWEAAQALAAQTGDAKGPARLRKHSNQFPFQTAIGQQLRAMEARYGALVEGAPDALVVTNATGEVMLFNSRSAKLVGVDADKVIGARLSTIVEGEFVTRLFTQGAEAAVTAAGDEALTGIELAGIRQDGSRFPIEAMVALVESSEGPMLSLSIRDVSARRATERRLADAETRYRNLIDAAPDAIIAVNKRGRITLVNSRTEEMFGYDRAELLGKPVASVLPRDLADRLTEDTGDGPSGNADNDSFEHVGRRKDGSDIAIEARFGSLQNGRGTMAVVAIRDLSRQSRALRRSAELENFHRQLVDAAPDAIVVVNARGEIVLFNREAEASFGYQRDELVGQQVTRILPDGFIERLADRLHQAEAALARELGTGIELVGQRKDGLRFPVEIMLSPLETPGGTLMIATVRDITVRKAAERHAITAQHEVAAAASTASGAAANDEMRQFAYVAAHDLQEPLRMVASYVDLLAKTQRDRLDDEGREFAGFALEGTRQMQALISDLLQYCKLGGEPLRLARFASRDAVADAEQVLAAAIAQSGAVVTVGPLPELTASRSQLSRLFQNIIGNAIKYRGRATPQIRISAAPGGPGEWIFAVADNGIGIDARHLERIFGMFQRLNPSPDIPGTGIGLAIARKIAERHGGRIWAESVPRAGSTFFIALPEAGPA